MPKRRRGRGEGGLFQLHTPECPPPDDEGNRPRHTCRGLWRAVLIDDRGKRVYLHAKTKAKAQEKLTAARQEITEHGQVTRNRSTVEQWLTYWLAEIASRRVKPGSVGSYRVAVEQHLIPYIGRIRLDRLNRPHIRQLHRDLEQTVRERHGRDCPPPDETGERPAHNCTLTFGTIRFTHAVLSTALTDAVREGLIRINVARDERPRGVVQQRGHLSTDQARTLLASAADDRLGSRWLFALLTGCRQGERLGLRWDHVDIDSTDPAVDISWQMSEVRWSHGCGNGGCGNRPASCPDRTLNTPLGWEHVSLSGGQVLMRPKAAKRKVIPLVPAVVATLRARRDAYASERDRYTTDHGLVWCHPDGRPVGRRVDYTHWRAALDTAGLPPIELHALRHTTASLLDELGVHEGIVQEILGHSRITTTRGYTHRDRTQARAALAQLGDVLGLAAQ